MGDPLPEYDRIIKISISTDPKKSLQATKTATLSKNSSLYQQYCASCHGNDGTVLKGIFPAFKESAIVKNGELPLIKKIIKGSTGGSVIDGVTYDAPMPSFSFLRDKEIEEIANYVRNLQSGEYRKVNPQAIQKAREQ